MLVRWQAPTCGAKLIDTGVMPRGARYAEMEATLPAVKWP